MDSIFYVMAILGCGDGNLGCTVARTVPTRFETVAECQANLPAALAQNTDLSFPVITATCRRTMPEIARTEVRRARG